MSTITFEEASRCPKCGNPGEEQSNEARPGVDGSTIRVVRCMNPPCRWFDTDWIIQVNSDNTVPVREGNQPKSFPPMVGMTTEKARQAAKNIQQEERKRR